MEEIYIYHSGRMLPKNEMPEKQDYIVLAVAFVVAVIATYFIMS